eukprot:Sspe_Gene.59659::Locus_32775_Transcript_1_1_Confidence_1.000_Length_1936::g.59659::m.59659/K11839/USP8, UBP5; ubiquitin carboxyl-terminal hydrolase 8
MPSSYEEERAILAKPLLPFDCDKTFQDYYGEIERKAEMGLVVDPSRDVNMYPGAFDILHEEAESAMKLRRWDWGAYFLLRTVLLFLKLKKHPNFKNLPRVDHMRTKLRAEESCTTLEALKGAQLHEFYHQQLAMMEQRRAEQEKEQKELEERRKAEAEQERLRAAAEEKRRKEFEEEERRCAEQKKREMEQQYEKNKKLMEEHQRRQQQLESDQKKLQAMRWSFDQLKATGGEMQPRRGIVNLGNTCYMNSVLQAINMSPLGDFLRSKDVYKMINLANPMASGRVANTMMDVMNEMAQAVKYPVSPSHLKMAIGQLNSSFAGRSQQCANEFFRTCLDGLHEDMNEARGPTAKMVQEVEAGDRPDVEVARATEIEYQKNNKSPISAMFGYMDRSKLTCPECGYVSRTFSVQSTLDVEVAKPIIGRATTLEACLDMYTREERLPNSSKWKCGKCSKMVSATKQLSLWTCPENLVIGLKRFSSSGTRAAKINTEVVFPVSLDLAPYVIGMPQYQAVPYELTAIVQHDGSLGSGHYTADVKGSRDGRWFWHSDTQYRPSTGKCRFAQAYMLFYRRLPMIPRVEKPLPPPPPETHPPANPSPTPPALSDGAEEASLPMP